MAKVMSGKKATQRREALEALGAVAERLDLPAGEAPTMAQFDRAAAELELDWSSARVIRVWERWRLASEVFKGEREARSYIGRDFHATRDLSRKNQEEPLRGVEQWLRSHPQRPTAGAYDEFVKTYNAGKASGDKRLVTSGTVSDALQLRWPNVIAVARGMVSLTRARKRELADLLPSDPTEAILGLPGVARFLKRSKSAVVRASKESRQFPVPVAVIEGHRAWLYEDLKLYKRGLAYPKRSKGELQYLYMDATELRTRLNLSLGMLQRRIKDKRWDLVPRPEGAIAAGVPYWLRKEVEDWLRVKGKAELTPEQEDEIKKANARRAAVLGASLKAARLNEPRRHRKRGKRRKTI